MRQCWILVGVMSIVSIKIKAQSGSGGVNPLEKMHIYGERFSPSGILTQMLHGNEDSVCSAGSTISVPYLIPALTNTILAARIPSKGYYLHSYTKWMLYHQYRQWQQVAGLSKYFYKWAIGIKGIYERVTWGEGSRESTTALQLELCIQPGNNIQTVIVLQNPLRLNVEDERLWKASAMSINTSVKISGQWKSFLHIDSAAEELINVFSVQQIKCLPGVECVIALPLKGNQLKTMITVATQKLCYSALIGWQPRLGVSTGMTIIYSFFKVRP